MPARAGRRRNDAERAELLDDLGWIEPHAELYRARGGRTALQTAVAERFFARYGRQPGDAFTRDNKRIKNLRDEHARAQRVQNAARTCKRLPAWPAPPTNSPTIPSRVARSPSQTRARYEALTTVLIAAAQERCHGPHRRNIRLADLPKFTGLKRTQIQHYVANGGFRSPSGWASAPRAGCAPRLSLGSRNVLPPAVGRLAERLSSYSIAEARSRQAGIINGEQEDNYNAAKEHQRKRRRRRRRRLLFTQRSKSAASKTAMRRSLRS